MIPCHDAGKRGGLFVRKESSESEHAGRKRMEYIWPEGRVVPSFLRARI